MCGVVGYSGSSLSSTLENQLSTKVMASISHRGPDDSGSYVSPDRDCFLGHLRLSILDTSGAGHQPMFDASGRYVISYNGEIYNYLELREELGPFCWRSGTDTEVILEGYSRFGENFFSKMNGIFSLCLYDTVERNLLVLRDPLGIKPMFFVTQDGESFFCSEMKGLLALPHIRRDLRVQSLADQLTFMYIPEPFTYFQQIKKLQPGTLKIYRHGKEAYSKYIFDNLSSPISFTSDADTIEQFQHCFGAAVRRQLRSDVPISLMLSGGVDSSAVAAGVYACGGALTDAYTIAIPASDQLLDLQSDDLVFATIVANKFQFELHTIEAQRRFLDEIVNIMPSLEDGISDPAALNTYLICKQARSSGIKVMLTGQGPDEFLGGYRRYYAARILQRIPRFLAPLLKSLSTLIPSMVSGSLNARARRLKRFLELAALRQDEQLIQLFTRATQSALLPLFRDPSGLNFADDLRQSLRRADSVELVERIIEVDRRYDLISLNLTYTDRMSMAVGVEARVPFLDFELVRLMNSLPPNLKLRGTTGKFILKEAMKSFLPHEVIYREKAGFGLPLRAWMRESSDLIDHYLNGKRILRQGIFDDKRVEEALKAHHTGHVDNANLIFSFLCMQMNLERFGIE